VTNALGIAGSMASGLLEYLADGSSTKRLHPGWAAHAGIIASRLAAHGATGPSTVIEGRFGLYHAFVGRDDVDIAAMVDDLGQRWETPRIAFKPYPACHYIHAPLDAAVRVLGETPVAIDEVEEIVVFTPEAGVSLVLEPLADKHHPRTEYEAKFSLPYSIASLLIRGTVDVSTYTDDAIADPEVLKLASKVRYETKDYDTFPQALPGGVRIRIRDGRELEADVRYQRGGPENPMTSPQIREKFRTNAALAFDDGDLSALEEAIMSLEGCEDLGAFTALARAGVRESIAAA
jgi:2-methylcitrate dehydratase PrpD